MVNAKVEGEMARAEEGMAEVDGAEVEGVESWQHLAAGRPLVSFFGRGLVGGCFGVNTLFNNPLLHELI